MIYLSCLVLIFCSSCLFLPFSSDRRFFSANSSLSRRSRVTASFCSTFSRSSMSRNFCSHAWSQRVLTYKLSAEMSQGTVHLEKCQIRGEEFGLHSDVCSSVSPSSAAPAAVSVQRPQWWWGTGNVAGQSYSCLSCWSSETSSLCTSPLMCIKPWGRAPRSPLREKMHRKMEPSRDISAPPTWN